MGLLEMGQNCPARSLKERVASLWQDLQKVYKDNKTEYRIDTLTPQKLNKGGNVPTLKALAAQVRLLMPLLPILAEKHFDFRIPHQLACQKLARFIGKAYTYMESNQLQKLPGACQKVAEQYKQLQAEAEKGDHFNSWHIMPKMHLFQHLCEMGSSCKDFWTYKDETAGGTFAKFFVRRGGKDTTALKSWKGGLASKTGQPFLEFAIAPPCNCNTDASVAGLQEATWG